MRRKKQHNPEAPFRTRLIARGKHDRVRAITIGRRRQWLGDSYVRLLDISWKRLTLIIIMAYFLINFLFADLYLFIGDGIENARPGSFADAFFFSVQTLSTIGYGKLSPVGLAANLLVTLEALMGFGFYAVVTGLVFSKFSRPTSRVIFSNVAVIAPYNGVPHLMLRLANERGNRIVDASIHLSILRNEVSSEGVRMRRFHDLPLVRSRVPLLQLTWTIMHPIDENSPLYHATPQTLLENEVEIIVSLTGLDETLSQTIHARFSYVADEILCNRQFEDIIRRRDDQRLEINFSLFHETRPL